MQAAHNSTTRPGHGTASRDPWESAVGQAAQAMMRRHGVPGLSLAVVSRRQVLMADGYGIADWSGPSAASTSTSYLWFSMTKIVTATAAMRLADEGRLDLGAAVSSYLEYFRSPGSTEATVRQLLTHTSGLGNPLPIRWVHPAEARRPDPEALLRRLLRGRRIHRHPIGGPARYSNVGYLALGQVIARVAGMPFQDYVERYVLHPLGMSHTGFAYQPEAERARGYVSAPRLADPVLRGILPAGVVGTRHGHHLGLEPFYVDGAAYGGLVGDVTDAARFLQLHLRDGEMDGTRVLAPETARQMRNIDHPGKPFDHGLGWFRPRTGSSAWVEHYGAGAGYWNVMRLYPDRGIGVVIMSNSTRTYDFEPLMTLITRGASPAGMSF